MYLIYLTQILNNQRKLRLPFGSVELPLIKLPYGSVVIPLINY